MGNRVGDRTTGLMRASASIPLKPLDLRRFLIVGLTTGSTTPNDTGCIFLSTCRHKPLLPFSVPSVEESEGMEGRGSPWLSEGEKQEAGVFLWAWW